LNQKAVPGSAVLNKFRNIHCHP